MITLDLQIINRKIKTHIVLDRYTYRQMIITSKLITGSLAGLVAGSIRNSAAEKRNKTTLISKADKTYVFDKIDLQSVIKINNDNQ